MLLAVSRVDGDERRFAVLSKAAGVLPIDDRAARENHHAILLRERERQVLPLHEITGDRMAPAHVPPFISFWIVLVKKVPLPLVEDHPVWIVHPVLRRCEMELRPPRFV